MSVRPATLQFLSDAMLRPAATDKQSSGEDQALVAAVRRGDERAFERLFHLYYEPLFAYVVTYLRDREAAQEVMQDLFCRIWTGRADWVVRGSVRGYLYIAARNRAAGRVRRRALEHHWEAQAAGLAPSEPAGIAMGESPLAPDVQVATQELEVALARAVAALPLRRREAYVLRWQHHLSYAEIADIMGISTKGVDVALTKAHRAIREALGAHLL